MTNMASGGSGPRRAPGGVRRYLCPFVASDLRGPASIDAAMKTMRGSVS
jgi:hypothetical protein